jgi:signal transduction histidine kinase
VTTVLQRLQSGLSRALGKGWYRQLFWKMFLVIWLVSAIGMTSVFLYLSSRVDSVHRLEVLEARARGQAQLMLERYEEEDPRWLREGRDHHRVRLWIYPQGSDQPITPWRRDPPADAHVFNLTTDAGAEYRVHVPRPPEGVFADRLLGRLFSLQMGLILVVSTLSGLLLSALVVRPIRQLSRHVRNLHQQQDLSLRADDRLSRRRDELGELSREFDQMAEYVETTLLNQQRLLQDVSHELRAPLARLQVAAGLAEQRLGDDNPLSRRINRECERLNGLIAEIVGYTRLQQAGGSADAEVFDVEQLFAELAADVRFRQPQRSVRAEVQPPQMRLRLQRPLLQRALHNGIDNALRHTPEMAALNINACLEENAVAIRLRDRGPGVSPELLPKLFDPFVRGSGGHGEGYGLGMSIAQRAIIQLGGQLEAHNHPDGGLELVIRLPLSVLAS